MKKWIFIIGVIFAVVVVAFGTWLLYTKYKPTYTAEDFGIISDKRNKKGVPYLIHNAGQPLREEDTLELWDKFTPITGHYRL